MSQSERQPVAMGKSLQECEIQRLVARAKEGDVAAFEQLYRHLVGFVHALCLRLVGDPQVAETLTQDAFVRAWDRLGGFRGEGSFGGWLRRLTVNVVMEHRRAEGRRLRRLLPLDLDGPEAEALQVADPRGPGRPGDPGAPPPESRLDLERVIATLPEGARLAFVLHDVQGYRHGEIAAMTGLAVGTIKAQLHRARRLLRRALAEEPGQAEVQGA